MKDITVGVGGTAFFIFSLNNHTISIYIISTNETKKFSFNKTLADFMAACRQMTNFLANHSDISDYDKAAFEQKAAELAALPENCFDY